MIASQLIVDLLPVLKPSDSFGQALLWMSEFKVSHLPLVANNRFVGVVAEEDILDANLAQVTFASSSLQLDSIFIYDYQHIFEVMRKMSEFQLTIMPILNRNDKYIGSTTLSHLMSIASNTTSIKEPGGVIVLRVNSKDYSLSQIAQIVESNNARILSSFITSSDDTSQIDVTIKLNKKDLGAILQTFQRYDYTVMETYQKEDDYDELKNRFDNLMNLLDL